MMPVGPPARTNRLLGLVAVLRNHSGWKNPRALPLRKAFAEQGTHSGFTLKVTGFGCGIATPLFRVDPADAIQPLLEHILGTRDDVVIGPAAKAVRAAQRLDGPRATCVERIDDAAVDDRRALVLLELFEFGLGEDDDLGGQVLGSRYVTPVDDGPKVLVYQPARSKRNIVTASRWLN